MSGVIRIGFTGTRNGMSPEQKHNVRALMLAILHDYGSVERQAHHGDCVGADAEFHEIAESLGFFTVGHPPSSSSLRAFCKVNFAHPPLPYAKRNAAIVGCADYMIAAPFEPAEQDRGGTWQTVGMSRSAHKHLALVTPSGSLLDRWPDPLPVETMVFRHVNAALAHLPPLLTHEEADLVRAQLAQDGDE